MKPAPPQKPAPIAPQRRLDIEFWHPGDAIAALLTAFIFFVLICGRCP